MEMRWLYGKVKVLGAVVSEKSHAVWNMKGPITIDFLEKGATVNFASYCQLLRHNSPYLLNDSRMFWSFAVF